MTEESWAVFNELLACGLREGNTVDIPLSIAVTSASVSVTDDLHMTLIFPSITYDLLMIHL
jgi:hypothetical protein